MIVMITAITASLNASTRPVPSSSVPVEGLRWLTVDRSKSAPTRLGQKGMIEGAPVRRLSHSNIVSTLRRDVERGRYAWWKAGASGEVRLRAPASQLSAWRRRPSPPA